MDRVLGRSAPLCYAHAADTLEGFLFVVSRGAEAVRRARRHSGPNRVPARRGRIIELVGGTLIAPGLFTSYAAFVASGEMAVRDGRHTPPGLPGLHEPRRAAGPLTASCSCCGTGNGRVRARHLLGRRGRR